MTNCPTCRTWTDAGPEFNEDSSLQRWNCGVCGRGPEDWHSTVDAAESAWECWANEESAQ